MSQSQQHSTILAFDTSADETSVALLQDGKLLLQRISSQVNTMKLWGGIVPMLARRQHYDRIEALTSEVLLRAGTKLLWDIRELSNAQPQIRKLWQERAAETALTSTPARDSEGKLESFRGSLKRDNPLEVLPTLRNPGVTAIAVTAGPGLGIALEVSVAAAKQLAASWQIPVVAVNHMEGHLWSPLLARTAPTMAKLPALGVLISGGHSELVAVPAVGKYEVLGQTLDDAAGECFDKAAVLLGLGYPGGVAIEQFAERARLRAGVANQRVALHKLAKELLKHYPLPLPMARSRDLNLSFSGLKTATLYLVERLQAEQSGQNLSATQTEDLCFVLQYRIAQAVCLKVGLALEAGSYETVLVGGGVSANRWLRRELLALGRKYGVEMLLAPRSAQGDNAAMIALTAHINQLAGTAKNFTPINLENLQRVPHWKISDALELS